MRLGILARMDKTGLANQTRNLAEMLKPSKVLVIDSTPFSNRQQYPGMYKKFNAYKNVGMIRPATAVQFMRGLDAVLSCEMFYSPTFINDAKRIGVKTLLQYNYEFLVNLLPGNHAIPDAMIAPSYWRIDEAKSKFPNVKYLPPPTNVNNFASVRSKNMARTGKRFLHVVGNRAANDRNGTDDLIASLKYTDADFELVIKSITQLQYADLDQRITIDNSVPEDETLLYEGFDALILPRRYAGLCLLMNEGLVSGLPVIMTNIDPNNKILPLEWLCEAHKKGSFMTKTEVDIYASDLQSLANKIEWLCSVDLQKEKEKAFQIGYDNFSFEVLRPKYEKLLDETVT